MTGRARARARRHKPASLAPGAPPGTLVPKPGARPTRVVVRRFGPDAFEEHVVEQVDALGGLRGGDGVVWVEVTGLADAATVSAVGRVFGLSDLSLEDVFDPRQRGKLEHDDDYTFMVLATLLRGEHVEAHPLSVFFGEGFVVTLEDVESPVLAPVRDRLRHARGRLRRHGADYLAYAIVDSVVDHYFPVIEAFDDYLEHVEDVVLEAYDVDPIELARQARADLQTIRKAVWPARDVVAALRHDEMDRVSEETRVHLRDCYDHVMQLQEMVEASREIAASLLEAYLSAVSLHTNEVMRVLAVIGTIFIPLTFLAGLYGMNFDRRASPLNMPELGWYWGYPFALLLMASVAVGSLWYFRAKGWFGRASGLGRRAGGERPRL